MGLLMGLLMGVLVGVGVACFEGRNGLSYGFNYGHNFSLFVDGEGLLLKHFRRFGCLIENIIDIHHFDAVWDGRRPVLLICCRCRHLRSEVLEGRLLRAGGVDHAQVV